MSASTQKLVSDPKLLNATEGGFARLQTDEDMSTAAFDFAPILNDLRTTFKSGKTKNLEWRKEQLRAVKRMFSECHEEITAAVRADLGGYKMRGLIEMTAYMEADETLANLEAWAAPEKVSNPNPLLGKSLVRREPKGVVLIISPWNYPIMLALQPMISAIAAGNCCLIKPSEVAPNSSTVMQSCIEKYMDPEAVRVVQGGVPETTALLDLHFDHICYTGNGAVARVVMAAAAKHLTPVTLELGGKSPVFIDKTAKMDAAVNRIMGGKFMNAGQTCIAPDYILVHDDRKAEFVTKFKAAIDATYGDTVAKVQASPDYNNIINARHVDRVAGLINNTEGTKAVGGEGIDATARFIPPTVVVDPSEQDRIMQEEIFGPALPVKGVASMDEAIAMFNRVCDRPLALYIFSEDEATIDKILDSCNSGGAAVNTTVEHITNNHLPFGGVGESGMGSYHGKYGFDEFSHKRGVLYKDTTFTSGAMIPLSGLTDTIYGFAVKGLMWKDQFGVTETALKVTKFAGMAIAMAAVAKVYAKL